MPGMTRSLISPSARRVARGGRTVLQNRCDAAVRIGHPMRPSQQPHADLRKVAGGAEDQRPVAAVPRAATGYGVVSVEDADDVVVQEVVRAQRCCV